jgi:aryl-alcohol dehydrogenase-like predicted oxidoreductase
MEYRPLGRTGVQVSKLCLGTMMFGAWGNTDHDDSTRIIHAALAADVVLDLATLDRIDQIVRPGVNLNPADTSYGEQVLQPAQRRR